MKRNRPSHLVRPEPHAVVRTAFDALAQGGMIGDPSGAPAYAYIRVSDDAQAEEGRSGLPRQLEHVHNVARDKGYAIPWDMVYADDHTGFEFEGRPALTALRHEVKNGDRRASSIVIEYLDRLSRNADWHQGYLLHEFKDRGVTLVFWKTFHSRIERAVMGAISQDGMEQSIERMTEGTRRKARSGRVTARVPAYGYKFVDENGQEGARARKETYYAVDAEKADIIRYIFEEYVLRGATLLKLVDTLSRMYPSPMGKENWEIRTVRMILKNPLYKGEFCANRVYEVKTWKTRKDGTQYQSTRRYFRPPEEWIRVPVPAIISEEIWDAAQRTFEKNARAASRNAKKPYLLTGLVRCAECGSAVVGATSMGPNGRGKKRYPKSAYRCVGRNNRPRIVVERIGCTQSQIATHYVDDAVWAAVKTMLRTPEVWINAVDKQLYGDGNMSVLRQIEYLEHQIEDNAREDDDLYAAYRARAFDADEFAARRNALKEATAKLRAEMAELRTRVLTPEQAEEKKQFAREIASYANRSDGLDNATFEVKRRMIHLVIDRIYLNVNEGWMRLEGALSGVFPLFGAIEGIRKDRG